MKKLILITSVIVIILASLFTFQKNDFDASGTKLVKVRAGHLVALDMAPLFIAKESGYFEEEGLDLETVFFANPGDNNAALASGSIQFSTNPFTLPFLGDNSGVPIRIISGAGGLGIIQVVIQGSYSVDNIGQLANYVQKNHEKKLRVGTLRGDTLDMILYKSFKDSGLTYDNFEMVWFNDLLAMVEAFKTKQIDILSHIKPYTTDLILNHEAIALTDNSKVWGIGTPNCTVAVLDSYLKDQPETIKAYLKALYRGYELIVTNPKKAAHLLSTGRYYNVSEEVLLYAFENQPKQIVLLPNVQGMMTAIDDMVKQNYIKAVDSNVIQTDLLKGVLQEITK